MAQPVSVHGPVVLQHPTPHDGGLLTGESLCERHDVVRVTLSVPTLSNADDLISRPLVVALRFKRKHFVQRHTVGHVIEDLTGNTQLITEVLFYIGLIELQFHGREHEVVQTPHLHVVPRIGVERREAVGHTVESHARFTQAHHPSHPPYVALPLPLL